MTGTPQLDVHDRLAIGDLVARYADRVDRRDLDRVCELFTADAVLALPEPPKNLDATLPHRGREEIRDALSTVARIPQTFHAVHGHVIDPGDEPNTARGRAACTAHHVSENPDGEVSDRVWHLHYLDEYRRDGGIWRFARRQVRIEFIEMRPVRHWRAQG